MKMEKEALKKQQEVLETDLLGIRYTKKKFHSWFINKVSGIKNTIGKNYEEDCLNFSYLIKDLKEYSEVLDIEHKIKDRQQNIDLALRMENIDLLN